MLKGRNEDSCRHLQRHSSAFVALDFELNSPKSHSLTLSLLLLSNSRFNREKENSSFQLRPSQFSLIFSMFLFNHCEYCSICQLFSHLTAKVTDLALSKSSQLISLCFTTSLGFAVAQTLESDAFPHNLLLVSPPIVRSPSRLTPLKVSRVVWGQVRGYSSG